MDTLRAIRERRSVRGYTTKGVSREIIEEVLEAGRLAPSAKNRQPWRFLVTRGAVKDGVASLMEEYIEEHDDEARMRKIGHASSVKSTAAVIRQAPVLILVFRDNDENWVKGDYLSIGACVENMCLRATDLGLGSLWIRDVIRVADKVTEAFGCSNEELVCGLVLGYASRSLKPTRKKELSEMVEWYG